MLDEFRKFAMRGTLSNSRWRSSSVSRSVRLSLLLSVTSPRRCSALPLAGLFFYNYA